MTGSRHLALVASLLLLASGGRSVATPDGPAEPVKLVRTLQLLQDQVAQGNSDSETARRTLIDLIAKEFLAASSETWLARTNADAALLYVLNGGNPVVLTRLPRGDDDAAREKLIDAVRAFAGGSRAEAKALWEGVELNALPRSLVGPSALVKASLMMDDDPEQAMRFVDIARLESPGTLIEEAAVRRGIEVASKLRDAKRFEFLSIRYAMRFPRSMYAASFRERFADSYLAIAGDDPTAPPRLDVILGPLAVSDRRDVYLEIARLAVMKARMPLALAAAENAAVLAGAGTPEMARAELYRGAALAVVVDPEGARLHLEAMAETDMPAGDRELLDAVLGVVEDIQSWPTEAGNVEQAETEVADDAPADAASAADLIARAQDAIAAADLTLSAVEKMGAPR